MSKRKGANQAAVVVRREQVKRLITHGVTEREICETLSVSKSTVIRDVRAVAYDWTAAAKAQDLYSVRLAFDFVMALMREYWIIYHKAPREFLGPDGSVVKEDRSRVQLQCLDSLVEVVKVLNQMAGIGTSRMFERLRHLESERARGFETRQSNFEEQMDAGVERLRSDIAMQRPPLENWIGATELGEERLKPELASLIIEIAREECRKLYEKRLGGLEEELAALYRTLEQYTHPT